MASLLESFYFLFEFDSKQVKEGKQATDDLNKSLSHTEQVSNKLGGALQNLIKQYGGVVVAAFSLRSILSNVGAAAAYTIELGHIAQQLNVNVENLDAWSSAIKKSGYDASAFQATLKKLGTDATAFGFAGGAEGALKQLPKLADSLSRLSHEGALRLGQKMGLDESTIMFLRQGRAEVEAQIKRQKELGVVTKRNAEVAFKFNQQWEDTTHIFRSLFISLSSSLLPGFTEFLKIVEKIGSDFGKHKDLVIGGIIAIGASITAFLLPPLLRSAAAALVVYGPFLLIGAAVAALSVAFALLYEDVMVFLRGGESAIGELAKKWPIVGDIVLGVVKVVKELGKAFADLPGLIDSIVQQIAGGIIEGIKALIGYIEDLYGLYNKAKSFLGFGEKTDVNFSIKEGKRALELANQTPIGAHTSNSIISSSLANTNKEINIQSIPITINTQATDATDIAGEIGKSMKEQLQQTLGNFSDGVVA